VNIVATSVALDPSWTHQPSAPFDNAPITSAIDASALRVRFA